jgi:hypothetical protein
VEKLAIGEGGGEGRGKGRERGGREGDPEGREGDPEGKGRNGEEEGGIFLRQFPQSISVRTTKPASQTIQWHNTILTSIIRTMTLPS